MIKVFLMSIVVCACALCMTGCSKDHMPPMGDSVHLAIEMQKLDPTPVAAEPVEGLDGRKAANAIEIYQKRNASQLPSGDGGLGEMKVQ